MLTFIEGFAQVFTAQTRGDRGDFFLLLLVCLFVFLCVPGSMRTQSFTVYSCGPI